MGIQAGINTSQLDAIANSFGQMGDRSTDYSDIGSELADIMRDDLKKRFASSPATQVGGTVYGGIRWDGLTDATFAINPSRRGGKIGIVSGQLKLQSTVAGAGNVFGVDGTDFSFELVSERSQNFSQYRQLLAWHPELLRRTAELISTYVVEMINE